MPSSTGRSRSRTGQGKVIPATINPPEVLPTMQLLIGNAGSGVLPFVQLLVGNVAIALEDISCKLPIHTIISELRAISCDINLPQLFITDDTSLEFYVLNPPIYEHEFEYSDDFHLVDNSADLLRSRTKTSVPPHMSFEDFLRSENITVDETRILFYIEPPSCLPSPPVGLMLPSQELRKVLEDLGLTSDVSVLQDNPFVGKVWPVAGPSQCRYLKLLRPNRFDEADILEYLATVDAPNKHVIRPLAVRRVIEGTILLLPHVGITVRDYHSRLRTALLSVAYQIFQGVAFLHEHQIAHCDLNLSNIVVDKSSGLVTIIDFDLASRGHLELEGFAGTNGWTAPEVGGRYNPIKADVWAVGKVVRTLCAICPPTADRELLLDLCETLMGAVPANRPTMHNMVDRIEQYSGPPALDRLPAEQLRNRI